MDYQEFMQFVRDMAECINIFRNEFRRLKDYLAEIGYPDIEFDELIRNSYRDNDDVPAMVIYSTVITYENIIHNNNNNMTVEDAIRAQMNLLLDSVPELNKRYTNRYETANHIIKNFAVLLIVYRIIRHVRSVIER